MNLSLLFLAAKNFGPAFFFRGLNFCVFARAAFLLCIILNQNFAFSLVCFGSTFCVSDFIVTPFHLSVGWRAYFQQQVLVTELN